jgi:hypothetical protein
MSEPQRLNNAAVDQERLGALYNGIRATFDIEGCETDAENWLSGRVEVFHCDGSSRFIPIRVSKPEYVAWHDLRFPNFPYSDATTDPAVNHLVKN